MGNNDIEQQIQQLKDSIKKLEALQQSESKGMGISSNSVQSADEKIEAFIEKLLSKLQRLLDPSQYQFSAKIRKMLIAIAVVLLGSLFASFIYYKNYIKTHGVIAEYFQDDGLHKLFDVRREPNIDFAWKNPPIKGLTDDFFSIRFTGFLDIKTKGTYRFFTLSDDGVKLILDNQVLIDNWTQHSSAIDSAVVELEPGLKEIKLEYFQKDWSKIIQLSWQTPDDPQKKVIPSCFFKLTKR